jgi:hypothetical protein
MDNYFEGRAAELEKTLEGVLAHFETVGNTVYVDAAEEVNGLVQVTDELADMVEIAYEVLYGGEAEPEE